MTSLLEVSLRHGLAVRVSADPGRRRVFEKHCLELLAWARSHAQAEDAQRLSAVVTVLLADYRDAADERRKPVDTRAISTGFDLLNQELGAIASRIRGHHAYR